MSQTGQERKTELLKNCFPAETAAMAQMCKKLTELEKSWQTLFDGHNEALGRETTVAKCIIEKDGITVRIAATSSNIITSLKFKEKLFKKAIENFIGTKVKKIEFAPGYVKRVSKAKEASRAYERYAPLFVTEEQVEKEKQGLMQVIQDESLAEIIGKTKAMAEKKAKRKQ